MNDFNLIGDRRPQPPVRPKQVNTLSGRLPLPAGVVLHESETQDLRPFGWEQGDPIPPDFAQALSQARAEALDDVQSGKLHDVGDIPPLRTPEEVPLHL